MHSSKVNHVQYVYSTHAVLSALTEICRGYSIFPLISPASRAREQQTNQTTLMNYKTRPLSLHIGILRMRRRLQDNKHDTT